MKGIKGIIAFLVVAWVLLGWTGIEGVAGAVPLENLETIVNRIRTKSLFILKKTLKDENPFVRSAAVRAAGESEDREVIDLLKKGARDSDPTTRLFSLQGLKKISPDETLALAAGFMIEDSDKWVRGAALEVLGEFGGREFRSVVRPYLMDPEKTVRLAAATALYHLGEPRHVVLILGMLRNNDANLRYQAIGYLGKIGTREVLPYLQRLLDDKDNLIIFYSLKAIGKKAPPVMFSRLKELTHHQDPMIRRQAFQTLRHLPAQVTEDFSDTACADADPLVRLAAAMALNRTGECGEVFALSLKDGDFGVRSATARVLGEFPLENRTSLLAQALNDPNARVRTAAIRATGMMGGADAFPLLIKMLNDPLPAIRAYAAGNLIKLMR